MNNNVLIDRHKYIGGSDLPNILDLNKKYGKTVYEFAKIKAGIIDNPFKGNEYTKYGQLMEPVIRDYINAEYNLHFKEDTIINEELMLRGNCDGIDRLSNLLLEVKTFGKELDVEYYSHQIQFYMELFDIPVCYLVGYPRPNDFYWGVDYELENENTYFNLEFNPKNLVIKKINRDKNKFNHILTKIERFRCCINLLKENPVMTEEEFYQYFCDDNKIQVLTNEIAKLEIGLLKYNELEEKFKKAKEKLYDAMMENDIKIFKTNLITITRVDSTITTSLDSKKIKEEMPEIYEQYKKETLKKGYVKTTISKDVLEGQISIEEYLEGGK